MDGFILTENGLKSTTTCPLLSREKPDCNDTEDDDEDERNDPNTVTNSVADLCSATHEFEWLSPRSQTQENLCKSYADIERRLNCESQSPYDASPFRSLSPRSKPEKTRNNDNSGIYSETGAGDDHVSSPFRSLSPRSRPEKTRNINHNEIYSETSALDEHVSSPYRSLSPRSRPEKTRNNDNSGIYSETSALDEHVSSPYRSLSPRSKPEKTRNINHNEIYSETSALDEHVSSPYRSLSPRSKPERLANNLNAYTDLTTSERHQLLAEDPPLSCHASPSKSGHAKLHKPPYVWPRRSDVLDQVRLSPGPYGEMYVCRRHLSPMRSSWCCPSPPPHCVHHAGMEVVSCNLDCCGDVYHLPYQNCACLPPLPPHYPQEPHAHWSPHHEIARRESSSPCALLHRAGQGTHRRSRSNVSRKRDASPSALSPRYSPVHNERHSGQDQWQVPPHSDDGSHLQKVQDLESDKKNLVLQVSVLTDQVEAQSDKISELEKSLDQKRDELIRVEQNLHQEMLTRSSVENGKIELLTELSNLRLRLNAAEKDRKDSDDKYRRLESELLQQQSRLSGHESDQNSLKGSLTRNGPRLLNNKDASDIFSQKDAILDNLLMSSSLNSDILKLSTNHAKAMLSRTLLPVANASSTASELKHSAQSLSSPTNALILQRSNSVENISQPVISLPTSQYGTMPRQSGSNVLQQLQSRFQDPRTDVAFDGNSSILKKNDLSDSASEYSRVNRNFGGKSSGVSFGKGFFKLRTGKRSSSEPYLEKENYDNNTPTAPQPFLIKTEKDKKGLMKFFSKFKKSGSQSIDRMDGEFKRGGIRATAGPRLGWTKEPALEPDLPFSRWNTDMVVEWFHRLGLSTYGSDCKRWMCSGEILAKATANDLEKELSMKNPMHRKKLLLAIKSLSSEQPDLPSSINGLDYHWVVRWLDDVGLPQYKDAFADARVDGRVLHCITVDDLLFLKVTSQLHHVSIRTGIQLLREKGFDPHCVVRRSLPDESKTYTPDLVALWSNHRVMEWLRTVDLSEYAPNLRGSGVHGAFIVYEARFNTHLFATLLNIPPTKTLLRRHLSTHFRHIVGEELMQVKRERETEVPLSPSVKVKSVRKQFALKKKRTKSEPDSEDYVCPMDIPVTVMDVVKPSPEGDKLVVRRNSDPSPQEQRHLNLNEDVVERIEVVSKDISTSNIVLEEGKLNDVPSTIV